jgi:hypothetical protein
MPESWWSPKLQAKLSQGDIFKELLSGAVPPNFAYLKKASVSGRSAWEESPTFETDNEALGHFLGRGRLVPAIILSHDCTIENDGARAKVLIAPLFPWSQLTDPRHKEAVLQQRQRAMLPLTNVPGLDGDFYSDLRQISYLDRRIIDRGTKVASMTVLGLERLQFQIADFFVRVKIPDENLAAERKKEEAESGGS